MPRLSIIVPVYQAKEYLEKCINSILEQSFVDFELILVDDGSDDGCERIFIGCKQLACLIKLIDTTTE